MRGIIQLFCAVSLFLGMASCSSLDVAGLFSLRSEASGQDRIVSGSVDAVAQSAQSTLSQMGFAAIVSRHGETVRVASKTANGTRFTLVLIREKGKEGEQTRVHIEWEGTSDEQMGFQVLAQLETLGKR